MMTDFIFRTYAINGREYYSYGECGPGTPPLTETDLPANYKALDWYRKNRHRDALFPSDKTALTENGPDEIAAMEKNAPVFDEVVDSWPV